jgi:hypothetical protein
MASRRDSHPRRGRGRPYQKQFGHGGHPELVESGSGYSVGQTWGALKRCWRGYHIASKDDDYELMLLYAKRIQKLQFELDIEVADFPDLGLSWEDLDLDCD